MAAFAGSVAAIGGGIAASVWMWNSDTSVTTVPSFRVKAESPAGEAPVREMYFSDIVTLNM